MKVTTMLSKRIPPTPLTLALLVACAFAPLPALAQGAPAAEQHAVMKPSSLQRIILTTGLKDGKMVFLDEKGQANPKLKAEIGDTIEITVSSGEGAQHDIVIPDLNVASAKFDRTTGATKVRFKVTKSGSFDYYCTIAGHRQIGMEGVLEVSGPASATAGASRAKDQPAIQAAAVEAARSSAVSVAMDPNAVPAPLAKRGPQTVKYRIKTVEVDGKLDDGTTLTRSE